MHPHVDSAHTDQDTPAESHTKAKEEGVLGKREYKDMALKNGQRINEGPAVSFLFYSKFLKAPLDGSS